VPLSQIAHGRSGDKGNHANVAIIAYTPVGFAWLRQHLTAEVVHKYFAPLVPSRVERFEAANLLPLNFVLHDVLAGGATRSLRAESTPRDDPPGAPRGPSTPPARCPRPPAVHRRKTRMGRPRRGSHNPGRPAVVLTLNRPDRRNALSRGLITAIGAAFERARD